MKVKVILFDLDGTLLDTAKDLCKACNATLQHFGLEPISESLIKTQVTSGMRAMLSLGIPEKSFDKYDIDGKMRSYFAKYYQEHIVDFTQPFEGILELCSKAALHDIKMAVITSKYETMAKKVIAAFPFKDDFKIILGCDSLPYSKPDPRPILFTLGKLGVSAGDAVFVGDHPIDIKAAKAALVTSAAALWGYGKKEYEDVSTWNADYLVNTPFELIKLLEL